MRSTAASSRPKAIFNPAAISMPASNLATPACRVSAAFPNPPEKASSRCRSLRSSLGLRHHRDAMLKDLTGSQNASPHFACARTAACIRCGPQTSRRPEGSHRGTNLWGLKVTDAGLKEIAGLKQLTALELYDTQITDAGLKDLAGLTNLVELSLWSTKISDAGLKELAGRKKLTWLNLRKTKITDAGLKEVARLQEPPKCMALNSTKITPAGLKHLAGLKDLALLDLALTDARLQALREIGLLHTISEAKDKNGSRPKSPADVVTLNLHDTKVTAAGLKEFVDFKNLVTLNLWLLPVTDAGLKQLANFKQLATLDLGGTNVTQEGLKELTALRNLKELTVPLTNASLHSLRELGLLHLITEVAAKDGKRPKSPDEIVEMVLSRARITDAGLKELAGLKNLTTLNVSGLDVH